MIKKMTFIKQLKIKKNEEYVLFGTFPPFASLSRPFKRNKKLQIKNTELVVYQKYYRS